jgi:hypothetical protein
MRCAGFGQRIAFFRAEAKGMDRIFLLKGLSAMGMSRPFPREENWQVHIFDLADRSAYSEW